MRLSHLLLPLLVAATVGCSATSSRQDLNERMTYPPPGSHFAGMVGMRAFDDSKWGRLDEQLDLAITYDWQSLGGGFNLDSGLYWSSDDTSAVLPGPTVTELSTETIEGTFGVVRWFDLGRGPMEAFLGAGLSLQYTDAELDLGGGIDDSDTAFNGYFRGGLIWNLTQRGEYIGLSYRYVTGGSLDLAGTSIDTDSHAIHLVFGFGI